MEKYKILTRFKNNVMTTSEYLVFCKRIIQVLRFFNPLFKTVGMWSDVRDDEYFFKEDLSDFEQEVFEEMVFDSEEYAFINPDKEDKNLHLYSKSYTHFMLSFGFGNREESDVSINISAGSINTEDAGIINLEFSDAMQANIHFDFIKKIIEVLVERVNIDYAVAISSEWRKKIKGSNTYKFWIGWITYLKNSKKIVPLLPSSIHYQKLDTKGVIFWVSRKKPNSESDIDLVQQAVALREALGPQGLLDFQKEEDKPSKRNWLGF